MSSRDFFLGKRIAVIGIGAHGEMLADIKYLVKANALVSVYDLRSEGKLISHLSALRSMGLANLVCGSIPADDLVDMDLIILSHDYPRTSSFLGTVISAGIEVQYPETLFLKLTPPVSVIGVMGSCGKSTLISMLSPMMDAVCKKEGNQKSVVLDYESGDGIVSKLKNIKTGDVAIMCIEPRMMKEIHDLRFSPHVAIFTNVPHGSQPFEILKYQTYNNHVIGSDHVIDLVRGSGFHSKAKLLRVKPNIVLEDWLPHTKNPHDREDAALAVEAARLFKATDEMIQEVLVSWKPLKGRLEIMKKVRGVEFINDSASVSPVSTIAGMSVVSSNKNLVLIFGGADRGDDYKEFFMAVKEYTHTIVALPGSGTMKQRPHFHEIEGVNVFSAPSLEEAVRIAMDNAKRGDRILFSPAFDAAGIDSSRTERGERFVRAVRAL